MTLYQLFSVFLIPVYHHRVWYFPVMGVRSVHCMFLEKLKISRRREMKKERGVDTPSCTMVYQNMILKFLNTVFITYNHNTPSMKPILTR